MLKIPAQKFLMLDDYSHSDPNTAAHPAEAPVLPPSKKPPRRRVGRPMEVVAVDKGRQARPRVYMDLANASRMPMHDVEKKTSMLLEM
ncbi:hypothetical protein JHW43_007571 [Diplocarpon mali]|nr:hypothetical protein JHW43_007571 [Diplocarpon mali]